MVAVTDTNLDNVNKNDEGEDNRGVTFVLSEKNTVHELVPEVADDESYHSLVIIEQTKGAYNDKIRILRVRVRLWSIRRVQRVRWKI